MISFNQPFYSEECVEHVKNTRFHQSGDGIYTKKLQKIFREKYNFNSTMFTPSCTHSLEMMAMLLNIQKGDEIIIPSFTFVSTANAFVKFGANIVFVDSLDDNPNIDHDKIEQKITNKTKAICIVHYAGFSCEMDKILEISERHNIFLLEDAAQAIHSFYKGNPVGSFGDMSAFSFHETKNINCGEGGLLVINNHSFIERAEIIREKGTNRTDFFNKKIDKYEWIDIGSSYLLSEINVAYLFHQVENIENIIEYRKKLWYLYKNNIVSNDIFTTCSELQDRTGNYHIFYLLFHDRNMLQKMRLFLKFHQILATTHYLPLHKSKYYLSFNDEIFLQSAEKFSSNLLRLPLYHNLTEENVLFIILRINFFICTNKLNLDSN